MFTLRILPGASRELAGLDQDVARRVLARLQWLAAHADEMRHQSLKGDLAGLLKLREGDYRVFYELIRRERTIVIHAILHRREAYRRR